MSTRAAALPPDERRAAIVAAALPLLLRRGVNVSTREIAEAAGIAEGTIFGVFRDKDAVIQAVLDAAIDPAPTERALASIDRTLPLDARLVQAVSIMQRRSKDIWRLLSTVGNTGTRRTRPADFAALAAILEGARDSLRADPVTAARQLRALTFALSNPTFYAGEPMPPQEIVALFLDGIRRSGTGAGAAGCAR